MKDISLKIRKKRKQKMQKIDFKKEYSKKVQPLIELGVNGLSYGSERLDYSQFNFQQEDVEELIALATDITSENLDNAPFHAMHILSQMQVVESIEPILQRVFEQGIEDYFFNDSMPSFLSNMRDGAIDAIKRHLYKKHEEKLFLFDCITEVVTKYPNAKDEFANILIDYINTTDDSDTHIGFAISAMIKCNGDKHIDFIREVFKTKKVDEGVVGDIEDVEIYLGFRRRRDTERKKSELQKKLSNLFNSPEKLATIFNSPANSVQYSKPKASRNDPCPCGSGKKYKKCCLNK